MNIFIAGTYGVGKSYFSKELSTRTGLPHFSSSSLIEHTQLTKDVTNSRQNQDTLIERVQHQNQKFVSIILDGHFCIFEEQRLIEIPLDVYAKLNITKVIVLVDEPITILSRLNERGGQTFNLDTIRTIQQQELKRAQLFCTLYKKATLLTVKSSNPDLAKVENFIFK